MNAKNKTYIRLLGTGAADWKENHECSEICKDRCARVRKLGGKNTRRFCSLFIAPDSVIDFTSDTVRALHDYGIDKELIRNVIITHGHYDHFQPIEIMDFASGLSHPLTIYGNVMVKNNLAFVSHNTWDNSKGNFRAANKRANIQVKTVLQEKSFFVGAVKVTPVLANHMIDKTYSILEQQALNYILEFKGKTIFYGLDSSFVLPRSFDVLRRYQFDIAVFDATFGHKEIDPAHSGHHNFSMLKKTIAQFRTANLLGKGAMIIASHMSRCYVDPYEDIVHELEREGIILAYDGMILEL